MKNILDAPTGTRKTWTEDSVESIGRDVKSFMVIRETDAAINSLNDAIIAMSKIANQMKNADYSEMKPGEAAKTMSYLAKMVDEVVRLMEFAKGNADSRSEVVGLTDFLQYLTKDQFNQLQGWIEAGKASGTSNYPT